MEIASPLGQLTAIHVGHNHIGQNQANLARVLLQMAQCFPAIASASRVITETTHHTAGGGSWGFFVVDDQHGWVCRVPGSAVSTGGHKGSRQRSCAAQALPTKRDLWTLIRAPSRPKNGRRPKVDGSHRSSTQDGPWQSKLVRK